MPIEPITHLEKTIAGEVEPVTHLEKSIAGTVEPVTHLEKVIDQYGGGGQPPSGTISITENGTYDVTEYAEADVAVAASGYSAGDWLDPTKPVGVATSDVNFTNTRDLQGLLRNRTGITELRLPNTECIPDALCFACTGLEKVTAPNATQIGSMAFGSCSKFYTAVFPSLKVAWNSAFSQCTKLESADFGGTPGSMEGLQGTSLFDSDSLFGALVLRSNAVWTLKNINAFKNTKFASGKAGGTLYVPAALISDYQAATNWSTILGYENNQIKSIESTATDPDAPVDLTTHYIDGTLIPSA